MTRNPLWERIQKYMDDPQHRYAPKPADLARDSGVSEQVLSKWKARPVLPRPMHLIAFAAGTGIPYEELLLAVIQGANYLPPSEKSARIELTKPLRRALDQVGREWSEELKSSSPPKKPIDLSDIFGRTDLALVADPGDDAAGESESYNET